MPGPLARAGGGARLAGSQARKAGTNRARGASEHARRMEARVQGSGLPHCLRQCRVLSRRAKRRC